MDNLQQVVANCPAGSEVMTNGLTFVYADSSSKKNYLSWGFKVVEATAPPQEVQDVEGETPLSSVDFSAKDAKALIEENNYAWGAAFVTESEARKRVLDALEAKKNEE